MIFNFQNNFLCKWITSENTQHSLDKGGRKMSNTQLKFSSFTTVENWLLETNATND